jgi:quercetin dioxygenase-like cupin family protein
MELTAFSNTESPFMMKYKPLWPLFLSVSLTLFCPVRPNDGLHAEEYAQASVQKLVDTSVNYAGLPLEYPVSGKPEVTALIVTIPAGGSTGWHLHPVPVYAYMLEGELLIRTETGLQKLFRKGDAIVEVMNLRHNGLNTGKTSARLVVFYTGIEGVPNVIKGNEGKP